MAAGAGRPRTYTITVAGVTRHLPVVKISDQLAIASFVLLGDTVLTNRCAQALADRLKAIDFDYIVGPEAKVLPLLQSLSTELQMSRFVVACKSVKGYMTNPLSVDVQSITTAGAQTLVLDGPDAWRVQGKRVVIVDDVVSTGGTIQALREILSEVDAEVAAVATVLKEGDAFTDDLIYLEYLPVFPLP